MTFSPAIDPFLIQLIDELDDGSEVIAAIWREVGRRARRRRLLQPSYESVRRLVHAQRAVRRQAYAGARRVAILTAEFLWNTRSRKGIILDLIDRADVERRRHLYQRRPRDGPSPATTPRGAA